MDGIPRLKEQGKKKCPNQRTREPKYECSTNDFGTIARIQMLCVLLFKSASHKKKKKKNMNRTFHKSYK